MLFVRHPACWLRSFWMYHERTRWLQYTDSPAFVFYANHRTDENFPMFVERYLERMPGAIGRMFERYERHADMIGHVESIVEDLKQFISEVHPKLNLDAIEDIEPRNDSPDHQKRLVSYAPGQQAAVLAAEHRLMKRHGY